MRLGLVLLLIILLGVASAIPADETPAPSPEIEIHGPNVRPGQPDAFALDYKLLDSSISPNKKYAVIYCNNPDAKDPRNFLVAIKPFQVLATVDAYDYYNRDSVNVEWSQDSSIALVGVPGKWGSIGFTLFELHNGRVTRQTNLYTKISQLLEPGFRQAKVRPYNDNVHFILDSEGSKDETSIDADGQRVHVDVEATSNPKPMEPPMKTWRGHLEALWSIPEAKWLTHKVTNSTALQ